MIQIERLRIVEFRGIRDLELTLGCKSFVVWGPNGSGKSGVVDAIEFALTGSIARLSGSGTSGITVLKHGPHVHSRHDPSRSKVRLTVKDPMSGEVGVLERSVKTAGQYTLTPDTPALRAAVEQASQHPELTLSRRDIIRYVVAEAGKRSQEVQAVLRLERIEELRRLFRSALTAATKDLASADGELSTAREGMRRHIDTEALSEAAIAMAVNARRGELGLDLLAQVAITTDLQMGAEGPSKVSAFDKASALRDLTALDVAMEPPEGLSRAASRLSGTLDELATHPEVMIALRHRHLVETGLGLVAEPACPLCDERWDNVETLRAHLEEKLARSEEAAALERRFTAGAAAVAQILSEDRDLIRAVQRLAQLQADSELPHRLRTWAEDLTAVQAKLDAIEGAVEVHGRLASDVLAIPAEVKAGLAELRARIDSIPDESTAVAARGFLSVAQERWTRVRVALGGRSRAEVAERVARAAYETYWGLPASMWVPTAV